MLDVTSRTEDIKWNKVGNTKASNLKGQCSIGICFHFIGIFGLLKSFY
jgi:hypothetical protein